MYLHIALGVFRGAVPGSEKRGEDAGRRSAREAWEDFSAYVDQILGGGETMGSRQRTFQ